MNAPVITFWRNLLETKNGSEWRPDSWEAVFKRLSEAKPFRGTKEHPGWSAARFEPCERALANVKQVFALCLDYDNKGKDGKMVASPVTIDHAAAIWSGNLGLIHTSRSHTPEWPRFRVVLPLSRPVSPFEYAALWTRIKVHAGHVDDAPRDSSRFWFLPGVHDGGVFETRRLEGLTLDVDSWLAKPEPVQPRPYVAPPRVTDPNRIEKRAIAYIARMDHAVQGADGSKQTMKVATTLARGFALSEQRTLEILRSEYNPRCAPPWSEAELEHKARHAFHKSRLPLGYLLDGDEQLRGLEHAKAIEEDVARLSSSYDDAERAAIQTEPEAPAVAKPEPTPGLTTRTMREILTAARIDAFSQETIDYLTTTHYKLDDITGGLRAPDSWLIAGDTSFGKCLGPDERVLMFDGSVRRARDVVTGDLLMGPDSKPRRVLSTTSGHGPMFRIVPERGEPWTCNWCHVLTVVSTRTGKVTDIALDEFLKKTPTYRHQQKLFHVGVEFPAIPEPEVDPWFLGVWYGDGTKCLANVCVTTPDPEVVAGLNDVAIQWSLHVRKHSRENNLASMYFLSCTRQESGGPDGNRLLRAIRRAYGDGSSLPESCLKGSREVRLKFLAGYIDSDGHKKGDRYCEIVTRHRAWAEQLRLLCRSLGFACHMYEKKNVPGYEQNTYWRLHVSGDLSPIPTRVKRKQYPPSSSIRFANRTGFAVEAIGDGDYSGWTLDGDGRFLLHDFTVTHNTSLVIAIADDNIRLKQKRVLIVSTEDSDKRFGGRFMVRRAKVDAKRFRRRKLTREEMTRVLETEAKGEPVPTYVDVRGRPIEKLCPELIRIIDGEGIDLIAFDYLQEFETEKRHQDERIKFKEIAKQLRMVGRSAKQPIPSIILSQLTLTEKTGIPTRANIRECKDVGNAADGILIGFEPDQDVKDGNGEIVVPAGTKCIYVDKNKDGERKAKVPMSWNTEQACFDTVLDPEQERINAMADEWSDVADPYSGSYGEEF